MAFHFSRDTKVFMKFHASADGTDDALYEIPVLDGYSFSQATNSSEITLNEAADSSGNSKRGRAMFNDSFAPAEWSFSTYMRPTTSAAADTWASNGHAGSSKKFAVEGPLWGAMSATTYNLAAGGTGAPTAASWEPNVFNFQNSNKVALGVFDLYFVLGAAKDTATGVYTTGTEGVSIYKISDCSIGSASIDFDIEGLAQVAWSGQGKKIKEVTQLSTGAGATSPAVTGEEFSTKGLVNEGIASTSNYIRQKLTSLAIAFDLSDSTGAPSGVASDGETQLGADKTYNIVLTGGNITIENNLTYLTPETLGSVNQPLGHVMGTRSVSGNFTCYLNNVADGSMDLLEDLHEASTVITNSFDMTFSIGGASAPKVAVAVPNCHLELPTHSIEDVIGVDVNFHALPADLSSATASSSANEITVTYTS
tara:strand:- start:14214 stop:15482 length:1269 start_codon:yes stop_codon:yes gene_type:complete